MAQRGKEGKKQRKYGRNLLKCKAYRAARRRYHNKLRRVLRSNGPAAAEKYSRSAAASG